METIRVADARRAECVGKSVRVQGWVRTRRDSKGGFSFVEVNDGSCLANLQIVADGQLPNYESDVKHLTAGCSVSIDGEIAASPAKGQATELKATRIEVLGRADSETYPLQKKGHSFEFLRTIAHLRPRTNTFGAVARVRNCLCRSIHDFFQEEGFVYVHTPIITASDCEGAGQLFKVTTLDLANVPMKAPSPLWGEGRGQARAAIAPDGAEARAEGEGTTKEPSQTAMQSGPQIDFANDFFQRAAYLTVSGQLNGETYACALGKIYTFGPTFRAENSNTSRHLAEFWMIEPEMAFYELADNMALAESFLKRLFRDVLARCAEDMQFFHERIDETHTLLPTLQGIIDSQFVRLSYTDAIAILEKSGKAFEFPVAWGSDLQAEHERFLTEQEFKCPVILFDYPKSIKAFYMRLNDDNKTVRAMDVLVPRVGEIIGGSQREERLDVLTQRMLEQKLNPDHYGWYLDLRRYGTVPHAGFGLGLERVLQFVTGLGNIRDVIPFPRTPGNADF